jgi:hypothetical protein
MFLIVNISSERPQLVPVLHLGVSIFLQALVVVVLVVSVSLAPLEDLKRNIREGGNQAPTPAPLCTFNLLHLSKSLLQRPLSSLMFKMRLLMQVCSQIMQMIPLILMMLFAVTQRPKCCFFCQADDHILGACAKFLALKADLFASMIVHQFLDPPSSKSSSFSRSPQPSSPSLPPSHHLCQLGFDTSDPNPSSEGGGGGLSFTDVEDDHADPDFWYGGK